MYVCRLIKVVNYRQHTINDALIIIIINVSSEHLHCPLLLSAEWLLDRH